MVERQLREEGSERLQVALSAARSEVLAHPTHHMSHATRRPILRLLGPVEPDVDPRYALPGPGLIRRLRLCNLMVKRMLPIWEQHYETKDPHRMLQLTEGYLKKKVSRPTLKEESNCFAAALDNPFPPEKGDARLAGMASTAAAFVALRDELLDEGLDEVPDEYMDASDWDCACLAAAAYAGGVPLRSPRFDKQRELEFWTWYLDEAIPAVLAMEGTQGGTNGR